MNEDIKQLLLQREQAVIEKREADNRIYEINELLLAKRSSIEYDHRDLIGRKAMCIHVDNPNPVECVCTAVRCNDDYETVTPLFSRNGKKYSIDTFEWVNL